MGRELEAAIEAAKIGEYSFMSYYHAHCAC